MTNTRGQRAMAQERPTHLTPDSELFKVDVKRQGAVAFPSELSEYISRKARHELSKTLFWALEEDVRIEKNYRRRIGKPVPRTFNAPRQMASILGVTLRTIQRWRNGGFQSCNFNADKLVQATIQYASEKAESILEEDLENHRFFFEVLIKRRQGAVAFPKHQEVVA